MKGKLKYGDYAKGCRYETDVFVGIFYASKKKLADQCDRLSILVSLLCFFFWFFLSWVYVQTKIRVNIIDK